MEQPVSKSAFAAIIRRSPGRITQLISESKLTPPAVTPDGKINVGLALAQLKNVLDLSQQLGLVNQPPLLDDVDDIQDAAAELETPPAGVPKSTAIARYAESKAAEKELDVEAKRRRMAAESGRWVDKAEADRQQARVMSAIFTDAEAWVQTCGQDLADATGIDPRIATLTVRKSWHAFRARQAQKLREQAAMLPELAPEADLPQAAE